MTKIVNCIVENILGVQRVEMAPNGQSVTIGGGNGEGKSSTIRALVMALGGKGEVPADPVHHGADRGSVIVELTDLVVTLEVDSDRKTKLRVRSKDGASYAAPQQILDKLFGNLAFDPGAFRRMDPATQRKTIAKVAGIDLSAYEARCKQVYDDRTEWGRTIRTLQGALAASPYSDTLGTEEISAVEILDEISRRNAHNLHANTYITAATHATGALLTARQRVEDANDEIDGLELRIATLQDRLATAVKKREQAIVNRMAAEKHVEKTNAEMEAFQRQDTEELEKSLQELGNTNAAIRANAAALQHRNDLAAAEARHAELTNRLKEMAEEMRSVIRNSELPIEDLEIGETAVLYQGVPFEQISESQQWEISTAIGFKLNPAGIVFMRNCGGLDRKSRDRVRARAAACGVQLFLEVVDDADDVQIVIEEGKVAANRLITQQNEKAESSSNSVRAE